MNLNSRFAGVSRAARSLIGSSGSAALAAAENAAANASEPAPAGDPPADPAEAEPVADPAPLVEVPDDDGGSGGSDDGRSEAAAMDGETQLRASERARVATVFASEHSQGRERQAADMLQTSMSADEITGLLAKSPKGSAAAADPMLAALARTPNPDLGASAATDTTNPNQAADSVWDKARAKAR